MQRRKLDFGDPQMGLGGPFGCPSISGGLPSGGGEPPRNPVTAVIYERECHCSKGSVKDKFPDTSTFFIFAFARASKFCQKSCFFFCHHVFPRDSAQTGAQCRSNQENMCSSHKRVFRFFLNFILIFANSEKKCELRE